jgi:hypothetical protein
VKASGWARPWWVPATIVVFLLTLAYVERRARAPEWWAYRERGVALRVADLNRSLASETDAAKRDELAKEIVILKSSSPRIIEVRPFNGKMPVERCLTCHFGVEDLSASHPNSIFGCVVCHGGVGPDLTVKGAHRGLRGGRNPATLDLAGASCGAPPGFEGGCHGQREHPLLDRAANVPKSIMASNAGIISILRFQWGLEDRATPRFAVRAVTDGRATLEQIPPEISADGSFDLASSHFRKFCASCHLWRADPSDKMGRLAGCPACHAPYAKDGRYAGGDPTIKRDEAGHPSSHTITNRIPDERCRACHNRSARVGLNYHGEMEWNQYGTPFVRGGLNDYTLSDDRFVLRLTPDVHHEKGMGCIDCHTGQDTMGDGKLYPHMQDQVETRCEDCHGTHTQSPRSRRVAPEDRFTAALLRSAPELKVNEGDEILETSKGRPMPHVKRTEKGWVLTAKLTGKEHPIKVITGKLDAHAIKGHERMECDSCHSAWSPQCFGCHQLLELGHEGMDNVAGKTSAGRWVEGRGFFRFAKNILGINQKGRVGLLVPGCQVYNTVVDRRGNVVSPFDSLILKLKNGMTSIAIAPTHPHTARTETPRCIDCHFDPIALGLGDGRLFRSAGDGRLRHEPLYDAKAAGLQTSCPPDGFTDVEGKPLQGASHPKARPFNKEELDRITAVAACLPCHDLGDDPVWRIGGPYVMRAACKKALESTTGPFGTP